MLCMCCLGFPKLQENVLKSDKRMWLVNAAFGKRSFKSHVTYELTDEGPPAKKPATIVVGSGFKWNLQALMSVADAVEFGGKSPVSALNEIGVNVTYSVVGQGGPAHCPSFTVAVHVADMRFEGWGNSKRAARAAAARSCLSALLARAGRVLRPPSASVPTATATATATDAQPHDFTADVVDPIHISDFQCLEVNARSQPEPVKDATTAQPPPEPEPEPEPERVRASSPIPPSKGLFGASPTLPNNKSPINWLYENYPGITFVCTFGDGSSLLSPSPPLQLSHSMRFKVVCNIEDKVFEGYGSSKKLAKLAAARSAVAALDCDRSHGVDAPSPTHQTLADHVAKLVNEKFNELVRNDLTHSRRKVLAGIVLTTDNKIDGAKVIAVTTGTKCVSGEHMSVRGRTVNDCHAEVAARRCLQRYLYNQLSLYAMQSDPRRSNPESVLEPVPGGGGGAGGYRLRARHQLHLYVSTAPCGDGRIFSPHEQDADDVDRHPNRQARGQLRTKIESGEGTIPVKNCINNIQTWDGVLQGERLLTMSCSDKVARWCVSGLQGALLSVFLEPVYFSSLVLGSLLHSQHMYRALCGRIESHISCLPPPHRLARPELAQAASAEHRSPARAPSFSLCWTCTDPHAEILNATTGKLENGRPSLLCKQTMFARFLYLLERLPRRPRPSESQSESEPEPIEFPQDCDTLLYGEAKQLSVAYQEAKRQLFIAFEKAQLGKWLKKPLEQDLFHCELVNADPKYLFA